MTRKTQPGRADRREAMRARLLAVVERLLADGESFTEISVERLVTEAGLSRSTFYVYFEDKGDLLRAWFERVMEDMGAGAQQWWALDGSTGPAELRSALSGLITTYRPHATLMAAMYDAAAYDVSVRDLVDDMMRGNTAGLRKHIRVGQSAGFVDEGLPAAETAAWLTWMAERSLHQLVRTASDTELERLVDTYTGIVWNTLYAPTGR